MRKRPAARILLIDGQQRLLLFRYSHDEGPLQGMSYWVPPGGALEPGESYEAAASRELAEETGIIAEIGPQIAVRHVQFTMPDGEMVDAEERYFICRTDATIDFGANPDPIEAAFISDARWWMLDDLCKTTQTIFPENIVEMMHQALGQGA